MWHLSHLARAARCDDDFFRWGLCEYVIVAQHAMKSRVRAYKNRAKGSGWQANWRERFCHSLTLKTSVFPFSIRLLFGPITSPTIKKWTSVADLDSNQEVGGGAKASGCRKLEWWSSGKKALRTDSLLFGSTLVALFALWVFSWEGTRMITFSDSGANPFFLFFTTCHISPFQVDLASHWTCWTETRWHAACTTERHRLMVGGVLGRGAALCRRLPLCLIIFLMNSTENFRVLVSRPRKKKPHTLGCFWWLTASFGRPDKAALQVGRQSDSEMRGTGSQVLTWTFLFHSSLIFLHNWHIHYSFIFHTWKGFFVSFTVTLSMFLLLESPRPVFSPCWGIH